MKDYEKLGIFYLGQTYDIEEKATQDELVLMKSKDLTTHAVIIGMTGSGKTGLGIGMIEEAAIDNIPVIAIDPKGDLGNLALTFPDLKREDFLPWVNASEAETKGMSLEEFAESQASLWRNGLADWRQDGERIRRFRDAAEVTVYTPGSSAGVPVSVLKSFDAPPQSVLSDADAFRDRIAITTDGLLSLIGVTGDPFTSREHILVASLLEHAWGLGQNVSLEQLIGLIQNPPMNRIGVMDIENFFPSKDRFALAMLFNNLLASPSFKSWMEGEGLDVGRMMYDASGKPRISVFSIAHLSDGERMFFVTMLLNEILSWTRSQPGTNSLRAMLYMDELFGYLPPTANPPSKAPLLTLLKQARAYGLGLVLATQNPVDLDYKALSNAGTWFIGRLQTERDKERVMAGLEGAAAGGRFDRAGTERVLAGLGQRVFYLHSVHEDEPTIFYTRWVLSYLAGPLTREQIGKLPQGAGSPRAGAPAYQPEQSAPVQEAVGREHGIAGTAETSAGFAEAVPALGGAMPVLPPQITQAYLPPARSVREIVYEPAVIGVASVLYTNAKHGISVTKEYTMLAPFHDGPVPIDWNEAKHVELSVRDLDSTPMEGATYRQYPDAASNQKNYDAWKRQLVQHIRVSLGLSVLTSPALKLAAEDGEEERDFRIRVMHTAHERRDEALDAMRKKYASKISTLEKRIMREVQALEKQNIMAKRRKVDAAISTGNAVLGALLGTKAISATSVSKMGTAAKSTNRAMQSDQAISAAQEKLAASEYDLEKLQEELDGQLKKITEQYEDLIEELESVDVRAQSGNITVQLVGLAWVPEGEW